MAATYDRASADISNILALEHINVTIPDQRPATAFYIAGMEFTRDPYVQVELRNMWVNIGRSQCHLPNGSAQILRGTIGIVVPDLGQLAQRLEKVTPWLKDTKFAFKAHADRVEATCPWGNRFRCHAPSPEYGPIDLGMPYVEFEVPRGTTGGIARFYRDVLDATAVIEQRGGDAVAILAFANRLPLRLQCGVVRRNKRSDGIGHIQ